MRTLVVSVLFSILVWGTQTSATTITMTPIADGKGTIGPVEDYAVSSGLITINNATGAVSITLSFNYPGQTLSDSFSDHGIILKPTDLLFKAGNLDLYGIPIVSHSLLDNDNTGPNTSVTAGHLYSTTAFQTALDVLKVTASNVDYRRGAAVWLGGTVTDIGVLTENPINKGINTPEFTVTLTGTLAPAFLTDLNTYGMTAYFGSADCGNGYLVGSVPPVPEPASLLLFGSGLLGMGGVVRRRITRK